MSIIRTNQITDTAGTGTPSFPNGIPAGTSGVGKVLQVATATLFLEMQPLQFLKDIRCYNNQLHQSHQLVLL